VKGKPLGTLGASEGEKGKLGQFIGSGRRSLLPPSLHSYKEVQKGKVKTGRQGDYMSDASHFVAGDGSLLRKNPCHNLEKPAG